jgi:chromosomal replication initiation ATPase DnaA
MNEVTVKKVRRPVSVYINDLCDTLGYSIAEIRSPDRSTSVTSARAVISYFLKEKYKMSACEIAEQLHREHASVLQAIKRVKNRANSTNPLLEEFYKLCEACE